MPANEIIINGASNLTWYVGDSKMTSLIKHLDRIGVRQKQKRKTKR
ncbi:hypothetical protein LCGC14_0589030 [marine sediment metagenome]|uniref:Uncharacterized protein n=1 Tax=marine sediment metagenome TaxID=412755 RepID=A0A0F9U068_9ZZZZ